MKLPKKQQRRRRNIRVKSFSTMTSEHLSAWDWFVAIIQNDVQTPNTADTNIGNIEVVACNDTNWLDLETRKGNGCTIAPSKLFEAQRLQSAMPSHPRLLEPQPRSRQEPCSSWATLWWQKRWTLKSLIAEDIRELPPLPCPTDSKKPT